MVAFVVGDNFSEENYFEPALARYYGGHASWPRVPIFVRADEDSASQGHCVVPSIRFKINRLRCWEFVQIIGKLSS